jgi:hypothetical protein
MLETDLRSRALERDIQEVSYMKFMIGLVVAAGASLGLVSTAFADDPAQTDTSTQSGTTTGTDSTFTSEGYAGPTTLGEKASYWQRSIGAPMKAFELSVTTGYSQGFGKAGGEQQIGDIAGPGIGVGVGLAYRASPRFSFGLSGAFQELMPVEDSVRAQARGLAYSLDMTYHLTPFDRVDVWASLGTGYRMLWDIGERDETMGTVRQAAVERNVLRHGFEIAKVQLGFDVRASRNVGIGPVIGADVTTFLWSDAPGRDTGAMMADRGVSTFIYGGLQGRFDFGGQRVDEWRANLARR